MNNKITLPFLSKYEQHILLATRAQQIRNGSKILVDTFHTDPDLIALEELRQKKIPFKIKRMLPNKQYEIWKIDDLIFIE